MELQWRSSTVHAELGVKGVGEDGLSPHESRSYCRGRTAATRAGTGLKRDSGLESPPDVECPNALPLLHRWLARRNYNAGGGALGVVEGEWSLESGRPPLEMWIRIKLRQTSIALARDTLQYCVLARGTDCSHAPI